MQVSAEKFFFLVSLPFFGSSHEIRFSRRKSLLDSLGLEPELAQRLGVKVEGLLPHHTLINSDSFVVHRIFRSTISETCYDALMIIFLAGWNAENWDDCPESDKDEWGDDLPAVGHCGDAGNDADDGGNADHNGGDGEAADIE